MKFLKLTITFLSFISCHLAFLNFNLYPIFTLAIFIFTTFKTNGFIDSQPLINFSLAFIIVANFMCFAVVIK